MAYVYRTPLRVKKTEVYLKRMTLAPYREGNSNKVIHIRFPTMDEGNRSSTPVKKRCVDPDATWAPMKERIKRKSNERDLKSAKKSLFTNKEISPYSRTLTK